MLAPPGQRPLSKNSKRDPAATRQARQSCLSVFWRIHLGNKVVLQTTFLRNVACLLEFLVGLPKLPASMEIVTMDTTACATAVQ